MCWMIFQNNPALNGLITLYHRLCNDSADSEVAVDDELTLGLVHGNGGLGYRQGVGILEKL
jgi:hypothetical protein